MDRQRATMGVILGLGLGGPIGLIGGVGAAGLFGDVPQAIILACLGVFVAASIAGVGTRGWGFRAPLRRSMASAGALSGAVAAAPAAQAPGSVPAGAAHPAADLRRVKLFREMTDSDLERIREISTRRRLPPGETLFEEGTRQDHLYLVISGPVWVSARGGAQADAMVRVAGAGDAFPLACLLENATAVTTGRTVGDVDAVVVGRDALLDLCRRQPELEARLFRGAAAVLLHRYRATLSELSGNFRSSVDVAAL